MQKSLAALVLAFAACAHAQPHAAATSAREQAVAQPVTATHAGETRQAAGTNAGDVADSLPVQDSRVWLLIGAILVGLAAYRATDPTRHPQPAASRHGALEALR